MMWWTSSILHTIQPVEYEPPFFSAVYKDESLQSMDEISLLNGCKIFCLVKLKYGDELILTRMIEESNPTKN